MNKYISACLLTLCATPTAFATIGQGFYLSVGVGSGDVDYQKIEDFDLNYQFLYNDSNESVDLDSRVLSAFNDSVEYSDASENVLGGRIALGYLWDFFEGEPTQIGDAIFQFNMTFGLEVGYRLFETFDNSFEKTTIDTTHSNSGTSECKDAEGVDCFYVFETATDKFKTQAADVSAVLRLPFTDDNRLALLLKGGVAYNMRKVDTSIEIEADTTNPPNDGGVPYNRTITESQDHNEFLPVYGAALEYMLFEYMGVSAEYSAITGSKHNADSSLLMGNLVFRL